MATRRKNGKPFDIKALQDLLLVEAWVDSLRGKKKEPSYAEKLASLESERSKAMSRALVAYHATKLTPEQVTMRAQLAAQLDARVGELAEFRAIPATEALQQERFAGLGLAEAFTAYQGHVDNLEESISVLEGEILKIDNAKYTAGITAYNSEMNISSGDPADHPINAGAVYALEFKTERQTVYMGFDTHERWDFYLKTAAMEKAIPIWSSDKTEGDTRITSFTRARKWAHCFVRGFAGTSGIAALAMCAQGKVVWSEVHEGGIGKNQDLVLDVGDYAQWKALNVFALESATETTA